MSRGRDTVIQGTGLPDPERETYLTLLKGSVAPSDKAVKVIVAKKDKDAIKKENYANPSTYMTPHGGETPPDQDKETYTNLLKKSVKAEKVKIKKEAKEVKLSDLKKYKSAVHIRMTDDRRSANDNTSPDLLPQKTER
jgi:hypothetical protein